MIIIDLICMLKISFCNWENKKNHGLCDVKEVNQKNKKHFNVCRPGIIWRNSLDYELLFIPKSKISQEDNFQGFQPLISINSEEGQFKVTDLKKKQDSEQPLTLIAPQKPASSKISEYSLLLKENQVIKIGKTILKILKFKVVDKQSDQNFYKPIEKPKIESINKIGLMDYRKQQEKQTNQTAQISIQQVQKISQNLDNVSNQNFSLYSENPTCKICYSKRVEENNSLVCFCQCSGSSKFIHEKCLQKWIIQKAQVNRIEKNGMMIYCANMDAFKCQICQKTYDTLQALQILFQDSEIMKKQYLVIKVQEGKKQLAYIISLNNFSELRIGREIKNHIRISDLTVSRQHCEITFDPKTKKLLIYDLDSKFGTTVKKSSFVIKGQKNYYRFLKGRTFMEIEKKHQQGIQRLFSKMIMCYP